MREPNRLSNDYCCEPKGSGKEGPSHSQFGYSNAFLWDFGHLEELYRIDGWYERVVFLAFKKHIDKHLVRDRVVSLSEL